MPDIASIGHGSVGPVDRPGTIPYRKDDAAGGAARPDAPPVRPGDRVELSSHARYLDQLRRLPDTRDDRIARVRQEISAGTYTTDAKLDVAIDRLLADLAE